MRFTTTDGQIYDVPDICAYCQLSTGGQHELHCPIFQAQMAQGYQQMSEINIRIAEEALPLFREILDGG